MKNQKTIIIASVLVVIAIFAISTSVYKSQKENKLSLLAIDNIELFIRDHSPSIGPKDAKVLLVEFFDPECESCRQFHPFVKKILKDYPNKIKYAVRYTPFHKNSKFAIKILEASRKQGKFWETLDVLFQYQPNWGDHHNPRPELIWKILPLVKLDIDKIKKDMNDPAIDKVIEQDIADAKVLEVRKTPSFFINGKALERFGYQPLKDAILKAMQQ